MREFLLGNGVKIVVIAATVDILAALSNNFAAKLFLSLEISIEYSEKLATAIGLFQILATIMFWLAFAAVAVRIDAIYRQLMRTGG